MKKNDEVILTIEDLTIQGEGIGRAEGIPLFVRGAIPGDVIRAGVTRMKTSYGYARLIQILQPSADRVEPPCPVAGQCGGCQLMPMAYPAQLAWKEKQVADRLRRVGKFSEEKIAAAAEPIVGMAQPLRCRNKGQYPVGIDKNGTIITGFYAPHSHRIVPSEDCLLQEAGNAEILRIVKEWMQQTGVSAYDEETHTGIVRHICIRTGKTSGQVMVCIVANADRLPDETGLCQRLSPLVSSIVLNTNKARTNVILGDRTRTLWGTDTITDTLCGNVFAISARSFYQVNPVQTQKLYDLAAEYAGLTGNETVWDLYCGIGTISLRMARDARQVYGIEIVPDAIADARENAIANRIENAVFFCGAAEELLPRLAAEGAIAAPDVVVIDPPRKGCDIACLNTILDAAPPRVVYVSCDPATLARDLRILCDGGYRLERYRPVSQFEFTSHVETVVLLSRV